MAKAMTSIKKAPKPSGISRTQQTIMDKNAMGPEPVASSSFGIVELIRLYNWYNYMVTPKDAYDYMYAYIETQPKLKKLKNIDSSKFNKTLCYVARQLTLGNTLPEKVMNDFNNFINSLLDNLQKTKVKEVVIKKEVVSYKEDASDDLISFLEEKIDSLEKFELYQYLVQINFPKNKTERVIKFYSRLNTELTNELSASYTNKLDNPYRHMSKKELKVYQNFVDKLILDLEKYTENKVKERKPRAKKKKSVTDILKHFVYKADDTDYKIKSTDPSRIIDATDVFTFNTKYKIFGHYVVKVGEKLGVHRSSIINFDETLSKSIRLGRKAQLLVDEFLKGSKVQKKKFVEKTKIITAEAPPRINGDTVILEIMK